MIFLKIKNKILDVLCITRFRAVREFYWNMRAWEMLNRYDSSKYDYERIKEIIVKLKISEIHELGCGPGRLIDLWGQLDERIFIMLADISLDSLNLAKQKNTHRSFKFCKLDLVQDKLPLPQCIPSLAVINKVLGALNATEVETVMDKLLKNYTYIYLCEHFASDTNIKRSIAWEKHDFRGILKKRKIDIVFDGQDYIVFRGS